MTGLERITGTTTTGMTSRRSNPCGPRTSPRSTRATSPASSLVLRIALLEASESPLLGGQLTKGALDSVQLALEDLVAGQDGFDSPEVVRDLREALDGLARAIELGDNPENLESGRLS